MNHYQTLGLKQNATNQEIKKAYKKLVKKYHPDVYKGDKKIAENKIQEINTAYEILSNPELRAEYNNEINPPINNINQQVHYTSYNNTTKKSNDFYDNIKNKVVNSVDSMPFEKKFKVLLLILIIYIVFLIFSFYQLFSMFNTKDDVNNDYSNTTNENYNNDTVQNKFNEEEFLNEINIEEYISDDELYDLYTEFFYLKYSSFDEFKSYVYNSINGQSTNSIE